MNDRPRHLQASDVEFSTLPSQEQAGKYEIRAEVRTFSGLLVPPERLWMARQEHIQQELRLALFDQVYGEIRHHVRQARLAARAGDTESLTAALDAIEACTSPATRG